MNFDLNIVAISKPTVAKTITRKKKNNKYERRRYKVQQAKETQQPLSKPVSVELEEDDEEEPIDYRDAVNLSLQTEDEAIIELTTTANSDDEKAITNETATREDISSTEEQAEEEEQLAESSIPLEASYDGPSSRRRPVSAPENSVEHAKYLAEFHARPLELDRRSGASGKAAASFESKHLFESSDWTSLNLHNRLIQALVGTFALSQPTRIQTKAILAFSDGKESNLLLHSETGSGKTLAYALPIVQALAMANTSKKDRKQLGTRCVILCPTRELASQTLSVLERLCQHSFGWLVPGCLTGGDTRKSEKARIRKGLGIVVATPGRMLDHLNKTESLLMSLKGNLEWLVLDEADRLLDMGLGDQVRQIVQRIKANEANNSSGSNWRSVLVSATVTPSVQALAKERILCGDKPWVWIKGGDEKKDVSVSASPSSTTTGKKEVDTKDNLSFAESTPRQLAQLHLTVSAKLRLTTLIAFLVQRVHKQERTVVFMDTCASVDYYYKLLTVMDSILSADKDNDADDADGAAGIFGRQSTIYKLHGSVPNAERQQVLSKFGKNTSARGAVLLATDVAARGLNLKDVDWIVQYDPPCEVADYVHRVGRAARAGKAGHSLIMLLPSERSFLDILEQKGISSMTALSLASTLNQAASLCTDVATAGAKHAGGGRNQDATSTKGSRQGEAFCAELQRRLEDSVEQEDIRVKTVFKETPKRKRTDTMKREGDLMELARNAYMSHIRAYPTKEKCVRHIFSARALHLGHVARSFALKEPPKSLASKFRQVQEKEQPQQQQQRPASLQFQEDEDEGESRVGGGPSAKKKRKNESTSRGNNSKGGSKPKDAKAWLLANAAKLESNTMDML
jgi:ATP-dependent RNA helicase DDX31/DBP7